MATLEAEALYPGYRFDGWAEAPMHKRVPSAGDMMVGTLKTI